MKTFIKIVKEAAHRANTLDIPNYLRKDWMSTQVILGLNANKKEVYNLKTPYYEKINICSFICYF